LIVKRRLARPPDEGRQIGHGQRDDQARQLVERIGRRFDLDLFVTLREAFA
jgi:hypothetical protein